jgi:chlorite dismutase
MERTEPAAPPAHADHLEKFTPDLVETGAPLHGAAQTLDSRLYCQLQAFTGCLDDGPVVDAVRASRLDAAVYANVNDPRGIGVVVMTEKPEVLTGAARDLFTRPPFASLAPLPDFTMIGRTYALGREKDLEDWLLRHPRRNALNPGNLWAVWYPLRRIGAFNRLTRQEQGRIMAEHASIGRGYGEAGKAFDIRLECHGLDRDDNEFVLGIVGPELYPLSKLIKDMRGTRQTSEFIQSMGPFFVGKVIYQASMPESAKAPAGY